MFCKKFFNVYASLYLYLHIYAGDIKSLCEEFHKRVSTLEEQKYDIEYSVHRKDFEVSDLMKQLLWDNQCTKQKKRNPTHSQCFHQTVGLIILDKNIESSGNPKKQLRNLFTHPNSKNYLLQTNIVYSTIFLSCFNTKIHIRYFRGSDYTNNIL